MRWTYGMHESKSLIVKFGMTRGTCSTATTSPTCVVFILCRGKSLRGLAESETCIEPTFYTRRLTCFMPRQGGFGDCGFRK